MERKKKIGSDLDVIKPGSSDAPAIPLTSACEFNSCPSGSPAEGHNASMTRFNYVNSYPVTSMRYGIQTLSPMFFGGAPDIAVAGFNVGGKAKQKKELLQIGLSHPKVFPLLPP